MTSKEHLLHYLTLFLILTLGLVGFVVFSFKPQIQLLIVGLTVVGYIVWGIIHHYIEDRLRWEVVGEYFLIGVLVFILLALTLSVAFAAESTPSAQVSELPTVHILPDNPLYFLKTIKEKVQLLVARNASSQADLLLNFAQKRLAEAVKVAEKGKPYISEKLLEAFGKDIETAQEKIKQARTRGEQTRDLFLKLQETAAYQKSVIEKLGGQLDSFLVEIDRSLEATESATMDVHRPKKAPGLGIGDWLRSLFGKKEILKPLAD